MCNLDFDSANLMQLNAGNRAIFEMWFNVWCDGEECFKDHCDSSFSDATSLLGLLMEAQCSRVEATSSRLCLARQQICPIYRSNPDENGVFVTGEYFSAEKFISPLSPWLSRVPRLSVTTARLRLIMKVSKD